MPSNGGRRWKPGGPQKKGPWPFLGDLPDPQIKPPIIVIAGLSPAPSMPTSSKIPGQFPLALSGDAVECALHEQEATHPRARPRGMVMRPTVDSSAVNPSCP